MTHPPTGFGIPTLKMQHICSEQDYSIYNVRGLAEQGHSDPKMVCTHCHPMMHPHTKFWIHTSNNVRDSLRTRLF